jgi:hypothetical protein
MKKLSSKNVLFAIFAALSVFAIGSCIAPVGSLSAFFNDPVVEDYIEKYITAKVKLEDSDEDLVPGDKKIEGLDPNKYYIVIKELDKDRNPATEIDAGGNITDKVYPKYVTNSLPDGPGSLIPNLGWITTIDYGGNTGRSINNLENFHIYTVKSATYFDNVQYTANGTTFTQMSVNGDGTIAISDTTGNARLNLSSYFPSGAKYTVIPITNPATRTWDLGTDNIASIRLPNVNETADYVFVENVDPSNFKVLRIENREPIGSITINITFNIVNDTPVLSQASGSFTQQNYYNGTINQIILNINNPTDFTSILWHYNGITYPNPLTLNATGIGAGNDISYLAIGTHIFTVYVTKGGLSYSQNFTLTVTP